MINKIIFFATIILLLVTLANSEGTSEPATSSSSTTSSTSTTPKPTVLDDINRNLRANGHEITQADGSLLSRIIGRKKSFLKGVGRDVSVTLGRIMGRATNVADDFDNHAGQSYRAVRKTPSKSS